jgi:hypothetical protein
MGWKRSQRPVRHLVLLAFAAAAAVFIVVPAARAILRVRRGSTINPMTLAEHRIAASKHSSMLGMSLPERLSAVYRDYIEEMQAAQTQAEADGAWTMPDECKQMIEEIGSRSTFYSELGQDLFLYKHFFRDSQDKTGRKRFFLDIGEHAKVQYTKHLILLLKYKAPPPFPDPTYMTGANSPEQNSNTLFFEKCLGWEGICVEANPDLAKAFTGRRKCKIENVCISNESSTLTFLKAGL